MANFNLDWDDLGQSIQDIVDQAVNSKDYQKLNQTITQAVDRAMNMGGEALRRAMEGTGRQEQDAPKQNLPALYGSTGGKMAAGILKIVFGGILSLVMFIITLVTVGSPVSLVGLCGSVVLLCRGIDNVCMINRFKTYRKALGTKTHIAIEKLARSVGKNVKFVRRELRQMIRQGLFLEGHLDKEQTRLITSNETYRNFEHSRLQLEARQRQEAAKKATAAPASPIQDVLDRGNAFILEIRRCNDAIPGEEISAKIDRMETIVRKIFDRAQAHPEIVPDLKKMMDYYLPMTVKLLNAYADMDAQPIQGDTIQTSKREIEATLDTLNLAFEKLLDSVFRDTALDVSSDISVLNTLLAQEGLTEDDLTKMRKGE